MPRFLIRNFVSCLKFLNSGDKVVLATTKLLAGQVNSSFVLWIKPTIIPASAAYYGALYCERGSAGNDIFKLEVSDGSTLRFTYRDDAGTLNQPTGTINVCDGRWHQIAFTKAATTLKVYVDTVLDINSTLTATDTLTDATLKTYIGADQADGNADYRGFIDDIWMYSGSPVLTTTQIQNMYYGTNFPTTNLIGKYLLDEGSGTSVTDSSGTRADGTITGATYSTSVTKTTRTVIS